jgi:hypothetical protein
MAHTHDGYYFRTPAPAIGLAPRPPHHLLASTSSKNRLFIMTAPLLVGYAAWARHRNPSQGKWQGATDSGSRTLVYGRSWIIWKLKHLKVELGHLEEVVEEVRLDSLVARPVWLLENT